LIKMNTIYIISDKEKKTSHMFLLLLLPLG